jgi:hypothetical protein
MTYVVLHHTGYDEPHYDLMVEHDAEADLWTWRVYDWPPNDGTRAVRLPDHRRRYLTYEGPISHGRGEVRRVERGSATMGKDCMICESEQGERRVICI